jgi:anti-sigma factor RsiW
MIVMKPCSRNRKLLAWLALGELDSHRAAALREHVESCDGCRRYLAEMSSVTDSLTVDEGTPEIQATEAFHGRLVNKLTRLEPPAWVAASEKANARPLTPSLSPTDGERVPLGRMRGKQWAGSGKSWQRHS